MRHIKSICMVAVLSSFSSQIFADPIFSPYTDLTLNTHWNSDTQSLEPMDLEMITDKTHLKNLHLAFITDSGNCEPGWGGQATYNLKEQWGHRITDVLAKKGVELTISFGGANGTDLSMNCNQKQLTDIFEKTINTYHANKLDFDVENDTANVDKLIKALTDFQKQNPKIKLSFTLPTLPEGLNDSGKTLISLATQAKLNFNTNIMTMDYGPDYKGDMGEYAKMAATQLHDYLKNLSPLSTDADIWKKIEITPMIGVNDVANEEFTLQNAEFIRKFVIEKQLGSFSMWSITRDKPCANKWVSATCSGNKLQKNDYDFVHAFLGDQ